MSNNNNKKRTCEQCKSNTSIFSACSSCANNIKDSKVKSDDNFSAKSIENPQIKRDVKNSENENVESSESDEELYFNSTDSFEYSSKKHIKSESQNMQDDELLNESTHLFASDEEEEPKTSNLKVLGKIFTTTNKSFSSSDSNISKTEDTNKQTNDTNANSLRQNKLRHENGVHVFGKKQETYSKNVEPKTNLQVDNVNDSENRNEDVHNQKNEHELKQNDENKNEKDLNSQQAKQNQNSNVYSQQDSIQNTNITDGNKNNNLSRNEDESIDNTSSFTRLLTDKSTKACSYATTPNNTSQNLANIRIDTKTLPNKTTSYDNKDKLIRSENNLDEENEHLLMYKPSMLTPTNNDAAEKVKNEVTTCDNKSTINDTQKSYKKSDAISTNMLNAYLKSQKHENSDIKDIKTTGKESLYAGTTSTLSKCILCSSIHSLISNISNTSDICSECQSKHNIDKSASKIDTISSKSIGEAKKKDEYDMNMKNKDMIASKDNTTKSDIASMLSKKHNLKLNDKQKNNHRSDQIIQEYYLPKQDSTEVLLLDVNKKTSLTDNKEESKNIYINELILPRIGEINQLTGDFDQETEEQSEHFPISLETTNSRDRNRHMNQTSPEDEAMQSTLGSPIQIDDTTGVRRGKVKKLIGYFESLTKKDAEQ
ncbi:hypothetical protein BDAP_002598 [Binucleata daphniae]